MVVNAKVISDLKKRKKSAFNIVYYEYYRLVYPYSVATHEIIRSKIWGKIT